MANRRSYKTDVSFLEKISMLSAEELLTELEHAGRMPDLDLIRECFERPEELTPTLLTWLKENRE